MTLPGTCHLSLKACRYTVLTGLERWARLEYEGAVGAGRGGEHICGTQIGVREVREDASVEIQGCESATRAVVHNPGVSVP